MPFDSVALTESGEISEDELMWGEMPEGELILWEDTPCNYLVAARSLIEHRSCWVQQCNNADGAFCSVGAINQIIYLRIGFSTVTRSEALRLLCRTIPFEIGFSAKLVAHGENETRVSVEWYNDHINHHRTLLKWWDNAIKEARKQ